MVAAGDLDQMVCREVLVVAMDLIAVAGLEQVEEVVDEVVDLDDCVVGELGHGDGGEIVAAVVAM